MSNPLFSTQYKAPAQSIVLQTSQLRSGITAQPLHPALPHTSGKTNKQKTTN
ncbi:rCG48955 [Rattus norvegicus]|uniref:RCG48955 n=1 Tax=Rattus norvegicus TaxID=10116 RepID=A6IFK6_RAT|nr:rCG48955 [Rattus norvegicus]